MSQGELFPDPRRVPKMRVPPRAARYTRRRGGSWCDDCIRAVHLTGFAYAEPVRKATWLRTAADGALLLCEVHKSERQGNER